MHTHIRAHHLAVILEILGTHNLRNDSLAAATHRRENTQRLSPKTRSSFHTLLYYTIDVHGLGDCGATVTIKHGDADGVRDRRVHRDLNDIDILRHAIHTHIPLISTSSIHASIQISTYLHGFSPPLHGASANGERAGVVQCGFFLRDRFS